MAAISIFDRLLGSLLGSYMGHCYQTVCDPINHLQPCGFEDSLLYQAWSSQVCQLRVLEFDPANADPIVVLPWLLYRHDDRSLRHSELAQLLMPISAEKVNDTLGALYLLGDCLEWLMQCSLATQEPLALLCQYVRHHQSEYPEILRSQFDCWVSSLSRGGFNDRLMHDEDELDGALVSVIIAIQQCLSYRENLAIALANPVLSQSTLTAVGCFLGAWGGTAIIPTQWMLTIPGDTRRSICVFAEKIYREWAGILSVSGSLEIIPLDL
ncbi:MAG: hypothetical protein ACFB2W_21015 [Leptolyngbyaceae cyanobacterium]